MTDTTGPRNEALLDISAIMSAPFWRPMSMMEMELHFLNEDATPPENGELEIGDGWTLAIFTLSMPEGRLLGWGWVKEPFAIHECHTHGLFHAALSHLPTGLKITNALDAEAAAEIAAILPWGDTNLSGKENAAKIKAALALQGFLRASIIMPKAATLDVFLRDPAHSFGSRQQ